MRSSNGSRLLWPQCFAVYERRRRPLKIGIYADILEVVQPAIDRAMISRDDVKTLSRSENIRATFSG
jgi:sRNA-binding protein